MNLLEDMVNDRKYYVSRRNLVNIVGHILTAQAQVAQLRNHLSLCCYVDLTRRLCRWPVLPFDRRHAAAQGHEL